MPDGTGMGNRCAGPDWDLDCVLDDAIETPVKTTASDSLGLVAHNHCQALREYSAGRTLWLWAFVPSHSKYRVVTP